MYTRLSLTENISVASINHQSDVSLDPFHFSSQPFCYFLALIYMASHAASLLVDVMVFSLYETST